MRRVIAALCSFVLAGCGADNVLGIAGPYTVSFSVAPASTVGHQFQQNGTTYYGCTFTITAKSSGGRSNDAAVWGGGEIDYRLTSSGQLSSNFMGPIDLQDWFGADRVKVEQTVTAPRTLSWTGPFTAAIIVRYALFTADNPYGEEHSVTLPVTCS